MAEDAQEKKSLMQKSGELIGDILGSQFETTGTETEIELDFAIVKIRHKLIRGSKEFDGKNYLGVHSQGVLSNKVHIERSSKAYKSVLYVFVYQ